MKKNLLFLLGASVVMFSMFSCSTNGLKGYSETETGMKYKFFVQDENAQAPALGDFVRIEMIYSYGDSVLFDTHGAMRDFELRMEESTFDGDIYEAVGLMKEGDSASFIIDAEQFFSKLVGQPAPDFIEEGGQLDFELKLLDVMSTEEHDAEIATRMEKRKTDEPIVIAEYLKANNIDINAEKSGLYFISVRDGNGSKPKQGDVLSINMKVMLMDGGVLYDSWQENQPVQFEFGTRFDTEGLVEGVSKMSKGQVAHLIVPSSLAFGEAGRQGLVDPYSTLLYDVELIDFQSKAEVQKQAAIQKAKSKMEGEAFLAQNATKEGVVVLPSGLQYKIIKSGEGSVSPLPASRVKVDYEGKLIDGTVFDSSIERGKPAEFAVNGVIAGWTEALQLMKEGDKWQLFIPSDLAYGENPRPGGPIEPNMVLIFDVELLEIVK